MRAGRALESSLVFCAWVSCGVARCLGLSCHWSRQGKRKEWAPGRAGQKKVKLQAHITPQESEQVSLECQQHWQCSEHVEQVMVSQRPSELGALVIPCGGGSPCLKRWVTFSSFPCSEVLRPRSGPASWAYEGPRLGSAFCRLHLKILHNLSSNVCFVSEVGWSMCGVSGPLLTWGPVSRCLLGMGSQPPASHP